MKRTNRGPKTLVVCAAIAMSACARKPEGEKPAPSASAVPVAESPAAGPPAEAPPAEKPPADCTVASEKVWSQAPNVLTGITTTELEGDRVAIGVLLGGRPHVLLFDAKGEGEAIAVPLTKELRDPPPKGGKRLVPRVTPGAGSGTSVVAFVDYVDEYDGKRRVVCGPSDATTGTLRFDGEPLLAEDDEQPEKSKAPEPEKGDEAEKAAEPEPKPSASPSPPPEKRSNLPVLRTRNLDTQREKLRERILARREARRKQKEQAAPSAEAPEKPAPEEKAKEKPSASKEELRELRACRSFVDGRGGHVWAVGSELVGAEQKDGSIEYSMEMFAERELGRGRVRLYNAHLGKNPKKADVLEVPFAAQTSESTFALAGRYRGSLFVWLLDGDRKPKGKLKSYTGGYPTLPEFTDDTPPLLLTSQRVGNGHALRALPLGATGDTLPDSLKDVMIPGGGDSKTEPSFVHIQEKYRFLVYQAGTGTASGLFVIPVDAALSPLAPPTNIADAKESVVESEAVALADGRLMVNYIRTAGGRPALVTKILSCGI